MEVDEVGTGSRTSSRSSNRRSPLPPQGGIILNRPLGSNMNMNTGSTMGGGGTNPFATLPRGGLSGLNQRDFSCPPPSSKFGSRRSSSGIFITSMFGSRFRHLQKLHTDAFAMGLNAVCYPGLPLGTMFRSSLPATPVCTPIHREPIQPFTEQALRERLCKTPSPRKNNRGFSPLDFQQDSRSASRYSQSSSQEQPMELDITCPSTPITDPVIECESSGSTGSESENSLLQRPPNNRNRLFGVGGFQRQDELDNT